MHPLTRTILSRLAAAPGEPLADDATLLHRFVRQRDALAFEVLVWRHAAAVWAACRRVLRHQQDAEDVFQSVWVVLALKAGTVRSSLGPWLHRVAVRAALRARQRRARLPLSAEVEPAVTPPGPCDLGERLDAEIDRLPEKHRRAFVLCQLQGLTLEEAALALGCPPATVGTWVARAKGRLRERLPDPALAAPPVALVPLAVRVALQAEAASPSVALLVKGALSVMVYEKVRGLAAVAVAGLLIGVSGYAVLAGGGKAAPEAGGGPLIQQGGFGLGGGTPEELPIPERLIQAEADHLFGHLDELFTDMRQARLRLRDAKRDPEGGDLKGAEAEVKGVQADIDALKLKFAELERERVKITAAARAPAASLQHILDRLDAIDRRLGKR